MEGSEVGCRDKEMPMEQNCAKEGALPELVQCKVTPDLKGFGGSDVVLYLHNSIDSTSTEQAFSGCTSSNKPLWAAACSMQLHMGVGSPPFVPCLFSLAQCWTGPDSVSTYLLCE